jgi:hypothetical protein
MLRYVYDILHHLIGILKNIGIYQLHGVALTAIAVMAGNKVGAVDMSASALLYRHDLTANVKMRRYLRYTVVCYFGNHTRYPQSVSGYSLPFMSDLSACFTAALSSE